MCTIVTHAAVGLALGAWFAPEERRPSFWWSIALLPVVPDLDVIGFRFGVRYEEGIGHRGATHSILFAAVLGAATAACVGRDLADRGRLALLFALAVASHGLLDMLTDGGLGIALAWPFSLDRRFWPVRPLTVPTFSPAAMFTPYGASVMRSELLWIWLPLGAFLAARRFDRRAT